MSLFQPGDSASQPASTITFDSGSVVPPVRPSFQQNAIYPGDPGVCMGTQYALFYTGASAAEVFGGDRISLWQYQGFDSSFALVHRELADLHNLGRSLMRDGPQEAELTAGQRQLRHHRSRRLPGLFL